MIEMMIALAVTSILGGIIFSVIEYADRQTKLQTEDIQSMILRMGGAKVLVRDVASSSPGFNYLNMPDDTGKPFYVFAQNEYCQGSTCERNFTLSIPSGQVISSPYFLLVTRGDANEMLRLGVDPYTTFSDTNTYVGVNASAQTDPTTGLSKSVIPYSPWTKGRLILLQSANHFYDCMSLVNTFDPLPSAQCAMTCNPSGTCDYATTRQIKVLGSVNLNEVDMAFNPVKSRPILLKTKYMICRPDQNGHCNVSSKFQNALDMKSSQSFYENLPYLPGTDNLSSLTPVELVRYHLERPSPNSPDSQIVLMRSTATIVGSELSFESAHILMTGVQSIVFTRKNISNPTVEYKLTKARMNQR
jgi:hypothetical protein